ncbi:MAG: glycosyltransferase family 2 protein [Paramuribaculum sp.]|nr:glycosyltransferase family 2 protein [Paramuribaculum sp.]
MKKLDVAIATWQPEGIHRVEAMNLPRLDGVGYVISWQQPGNDASVPRSLLERDDIEVHIFNGSGVSANRNNALDHCSGEIVLFADDDMTYTPDRLIAVIETFRKNPDIDVATFRYDGACKTYPGSQTILGFPLPKNYSVATVEIAARRTSALRIGFDPLFGPGAPVWQASEDEKFLYDARKACCRCMFFPTTVTSHPHPSTGDRPIAASPGICAAAGKMIRLEYPRSWMPRIILKAIRQKKKGAPILFTLRHMLRGAVSDGNA